MTRVTIYSRPECHLCEEMKAIVQIVGRDMPFDLDEIDISRDPSLEMRYGPEIPVLEIDGKKAAKFRVGEEELRRILSARSASR